MTAEDAGRLHLRPLAAEDESLIVGEHRAPKRRYWIGGAARRQ